jgi:hypothetical protein
MKSRGMFFEVDWTAWGFGVGFAVEDDFVFSIMLGPVNLGVFQFNL